MTVLDSSRGFSVTEQTMEQIRGENITVTYANATIGDNEYISAMLVQGGEVKYYGQMKNTVNETDASGTIELTIPKSITPGEYTLKLFNEQINGDYHTDLLSAFCDVDLIVRDLPKERTIVLGYSALSDGNLQKAKFDYVYYGSCNNEVVKWKVLSTNGNTTRNSQGGTGTASYKKSGAGAYIGDALFVISDKTLIECKVWGESNGLWSTSFVRQLCQSYIITDTDLMKYVLLTSKTETKEGHGTLGSASDEFCWETTNNSSLEDDTFFVPSVREVVQYMGYGNLKSADSCAWWTRSFAAVQMPYYVEADGTAAIGSSGPSTVVSVRPTFNLELESVLFTAQADSGKTIHLNTLSKVNSVYDYDSYQLTMKDTDRHFTVTERALSGCRDEEVPLRYSGAKTGANEYISAMVLDADNHVEYYGQIAHLTAESDASGTAKLKIPSELAHGSHKVYLFNEQINTGNNTDFSSPFQEVTLTVEQDATPLPEDFTFSVPDDSTYDGNAKNATVTANKSGIGKIRVKYYDESGTLLAGAPTEVGKYTVKIDVEKGAGYTAQNDITQEDWKFEITKANMTVSGADVTVTYGDKFTLTATVEKTRSSRVVSDDKV